MVNVRYFSSQASVKFTNEWFVCHNALVALKATYLGELPLELLREGWQTVPTTMW